jgi:hypothetical protein
MALIDMFTPVMIMLLIAVLAVDLKFVRYHKDERGGSGPHGANPAAAGA